MSKVFLTLTFSLIAVNFLSAQNNTLPVELTYFEHEITADTTVLLKWGTATEVNNYGFNVERKRQDSSWQVMGFVFGSGTSNSPKHYTWSDSTGSLSDEFFYRLKQIDNDGEFEYSDSIFVQVNFISGIERFDNSRPVNYHLTPNYPNPFNPVTNIRFTIPKASNVNISVFNSAGEKVAEVIDKYMAAGEYELNFNADGLSSGAYFYKLTAGDFTQIRKMLLIK